jgi:amino acid transporter
MEQPSVLAHSLNNGTIAALGVLHYFGASPQLVLNGPVAYGAFALILLISIGAWLHFGMTSWRTLGAPLPPDSMPAMGSVLPPTPPEALRL